MLVLFYRIGQTCNYVAGLLFKIEHANTMGLTSCTSSKCVWVAPGKAAGPLPPTKLKDMDFKKSQYGKKASRPLVGNLKAAFDVIPCDASSSTIQQSMMAKLTDVQPSACVLKGKSTAKEEQ
ncbi:uncharacterized protein LOC117337991 [Pecten maximus]|uniref:uncharacterized protein LOC117337991 n=1 Tax=Pecten maximus TaxID=6579 RepID=UPI0014591A25|nr:uncharacterized protein LOC117337991 [Pecten maximus]